MNKPTIVCLCGSTRFKNAFEEQTKVETLKGNIVLGVGLYSHHDNIPLDEETVKMLDRVHLSKIALADEILVINVGDYIGESTQKEIEYARKMYKTIRYLESREPEYNKSKYATELEWLAWFAQEADFGPADGDVHYILENRFEKKTGKKVPREWTWKDTSEEEEQQ
jgi:hypothetical protein